MRMEGGHYFWLGASADADPATHEPSQSSLSRPCGECPLRGKSLFGRWRLYADRLYRNAEARREFEREYGDWYRGTFGVEPDMQRALANIFPLWAVYRMAHEESANG